MACSLKIHNVSSKQVDARAAYNNLVGKYPLAVRYIGTHREMQADLWQVFYYLRLSQHNFPSFSISMENYVVSPCYPMMFTPSIIYHNLWAEIDGGKWWKIMWLVHVTPWCLSPSITYHNLWADIDDGKWWKIMWLAHVPPWRLPPLADWEAAALLTSVHQDAVVLNTSQSLQQMPFAVASAQSLPCLTCKP